MSKIFKNENSLGRWSIALSFVHHSVIYNHIEIHGFAHLGGSNKINLMRLRRSMFLWRVDCHDSQ